MLWLYRYFFGCLQIELNGDFAEKLINICAANGIGTWNVRRRHKKLTAFLTPHSFKRLRTVRRGSGTTVRILKKSGFPFFVSRHKHRVGFIAGAVLFFIIINLLSGSIWIINVSGNTSVPENEILAACEKLGVREGVRRTDIDTALYKNKLLLSEDALAWASFNIEGSVLTVNVTEVKRESGEDFPSNIKASCDGIISRIDVKAGNCVVRVGQAVRKGDILVSGIIEHKDRTEFVHSAGSIFALTERTISAEGDYEITEYIRSGKTIKRKVLMFFGLRLPLYLGKVKGNYDSEVNERRAMLFGKKLPVSVYEKCFFPTVRKTKALTRKELEAALVKELDEKASKQYSGNYNVINTVITEKTSGLMMNRTISASENIAFDEILFISAENN